MGTDKKLYSKFIAHYLEARPLLADVGKLWRFRDLKPLYIVKPEQQ